MTERIKAEEVPITTRQMRKAVREWLAEENATIEQALQLEAALYAGAIEGIDYDGHRDKDIATIRLVDAVKAAPYNSGVGTNSDCGCLLDTLERIRKKRPQGLIADSSGIAFALALKIRLGDTPDNNHWARAAVKGIEDYVALTEVTA